MLPKDDYLPNLLLMKLKLLRYMLLSKIIIGKNRSHYQQKTRNFPKIIRTYELLYFMNHRRVPFDWLFKKRQDEIIRPPLNGLNRSKRERDVIVSLTTHPPRIKTLWIVLKMMLSQTYKPDRILLYLAEEQFPDRKLPEWAEFYREAGVEFIFCKEDLKPHKKYYYTMRDNPEVIVVTVDDDLLYHADLLETLLNSYSRFPKAISTMHTYGITFDGDGQVLPFSEWDSNCREKKGQPFMNLLIMSGSGTLFPPHSLHSEVFNTNSIKETCLLGDDLWLKVMSVLQGTPVVLADEKSPLVYIEGTQDVSIWHNHNYKGGINTQLAAILDMYNNYHGEDDTATKRMMSN